MPDSQLDKEQQQQEREPLDPDAVDEAAREDAPDNDLPAPSEAEELEALRSELEAAQERVLRAQADLNNYQKRTRRELDEQRRYAAIPLIAELLPVRDNLARALEAAENAGDTGGLLEGVKLVSQQLAAALERHGCEEIDALGQPFDPNLHEAVAQQPSDDHPSGTVMAVALPGFRLAERVVRPAQVIVSSGPSD